MNSLGGLEDIEEIGEGQVTGKYFHFQIEKENRSYKLVSLVEILGEFLDGNIKKMVPEDLENKTVLTKRHQTFTKNRLYQNHLTYLFVYL